MNNKNFAFFEVIDSTTLSLVEGELEKKTLILFFRIDDKLLKRNSVKKYIKEKRFIDLSQNVYSYLLYMEAIKLASENLTTVFNKYFSPSSLISIVSSLYQTHDLEKMYQKEVLLLLHRVYYIDYKINEIIKDYDGEFLFYPYEGEMIHNDITSPLSHRVKVIREKTTKYQVQSLSQHIIEYFLLFSPFLSFFFKVRGICLKKKLKDTFLLGININLPAMSSWNYHYLYFFLDEKYHYPKNEIVLLESSYPIGAHGFVNNGEFSNININKYKYWVSIQLLKKILTELFPSLMKCLFRGIVENNLILKVTRGILLDFVKWELFFDSYYIHNHVTLLLPDTISKNIILRRHGVKTWYVYPDNYAIDYHTGWDENVPLASILSFNSADYAIVYGNKVQRYISNHRSQIHDCIPIGVLTAQQINEYKNGIIHSNLKDLLKAKNFNHPIIGVFDTSYVDYGPIKVKDGIMFGESIMRLLNDFPDVSIIFKEKKIITITPELQYTYDLLAKHPRCFFVRKDKDNPIFSSEVIAQCDLVISAAYTSTTAEALGAKIKAIYYDIAGTDQGDQFYFNKFPNTVAHNYEELKYLVQYWLFECKEETFDEFLHEYVKGEIDPYLDMKAIERLKNLILN